MPPPVGSNRGSSGAMVTWTVVTSILFVTATIFAIYFYVAKNQAEETLNTRTTTYREIIPEAAITGSAVSELRNAKQDPNAAQMGLNQQMSIFDAAIAQRNRLAQIIAGPNASAASAFAQANTVLGENANKLKPAGLALPTSDNLAGAADTLGDALEARIQQIEDLQRQLAAAKQQQAQTVTATADQLKQMEEAVNGLRAEHAKAMAELEAYRNQKNQDVAGIEAQMAQERQVFQQAQQENQTQIREKDRQIEQMTRERNQLIEQLSQSRPDTQGLVTRQADGQVIRVPQTGVVYVNLGQGDSVVPGLTFEVFDKNEGIPRAGDSRDDGTPQEQPMPAGKASIEIVRVGATSSEARITRQQPGTVVTEGDPIVNLVYDKNTKYNFNVYGSFDLDQNGQATPQDTEVIKRLITQWGGRLTDKVNIDTDFVVLGKEPELPVFTREELEDAFNAKRLADAQAELEAYDNVRRAAIDLRIPILNQNRFLYLIGYYNQATR